MTYTFDDSPARVVSLTFSPDGRHLVAGGDGEEVHVFDALSGARVLTFAAGLRANGSFDRSGERLALGNWAGEQVIAGSWTLEGETIIVNNGDCGDTAG